MQSRLNEQKTVVQKEKIFIRSVVETGSEGGRVGEEADIEVKECDALQITCAWIVNRT